MKITWESYLSGPRWRLPDGVIRKGLIDLGLSQKILLEYEIRKTTLTNATVFFKISGEERFLKIFRDALMKAINQ